MARLVFMGTAAFAVPSLRMLAANHQVAAVVTQPDRPVGRGLRLRPGPVKEAAFELGLPVLQPERASQPEFIEEVRALVPEAIVVVAYGQILRPALLSVPRLGCINGHASLLPELRGAAPIQWAILRGFTETGVTTMLMDVGMDTGPVLLAESTPIHPTDTAGELSGHLAPLCARLLVRTLEELAAGSLRPAPQEHSRATYAPLLSRADAAVDWTRPAEEVRNRIHGCNPAPGAFARRGDDVVKLWRAEAVDMAVAEQPGTVLEAAPLTLATGRGALRLLELQAENRSRQCASDFVRGYRVRMGEVWHGEAAPQARRKEREAPAANDS